MCIGASPVPRPRPSALPKRQQPRLQRARLAPPFSSALEGTPASELRVDPARSQQHASVGFFPLRA